MIKNRQYKIVLSIVESNETELVNYQDYPIKTITLKRYKEFSDANRIVKIIDDCVKNNYGD